MMSNRGTKCPSNRPQRVLLRIGYCCRSFDRPLLNFNNGHFGDNFSGLSMNDEKIAIRFSLGQMSRVGRWLHPCPPDFGWRPKVGSEKKLPTLRLHLRNISTVGRVRRVSAIVDGYSEHVRAVTRLIACGGLRCADKLEVFPSLVWRT